MRPPPRTNRTCDECGEHIAACTCLAALLDGPARDGPCTTLDRGIVVAVDRTTLGRLRVRMEAPERASTHDELRDACAVLKLWQARAAEVQGPAPGTSEWLLAEVNALRSNGAGYGRIANWGNAAAWERLAEAARILSGPAGRRIPARRASALAREDEAERAALEHDAQLVALRLGARVLQGQVRAFLRALGAEPHAIADFAARAKGGGRRPPDGPLYRDVVREKLRGLTRERTSPGS